MSKCLFVQCVYSYSCEYIIYGTEDVKHLDKLFDNNGLKLIHYKKCDMSDIYKIEKNILDEYDDLCKIDSFNKTFCFHEYLQANYEKIYREMCEEEFALKINKGNLKF